MNNKTNDANHLGFEEKLKDMSNLSSPILIIPEYRFTGKGATKISSDILPVGAILLPLCSDWPCGDCSRVDNYQPKNHRHEWQDEHDPMYVKSLPQENMEHIIAGTNGRTFLETSKKNLRPITFLTSARELSQFFKLKATDIYGRLISCIRNMQALSQLCDILLLQLLSGEIRILEGEKLVKAIA